MRRFSLLLVSLIVLTIQTALAQTFRVKGTVVSAEDNEPLIGATILQEGTTNGVVTDVDGNYTIEVKGASKARWYSRMSAWKRRSTLSMRRRIR